MTQLFAHDPGNLQARLSSRLLRSSAALQPKHDDPGQLATCPGHLHLPRRPPDWHPKERTGYSGNTGASFRCHLIVLVVITQGGQVVVDKAMQR
jgi:hypothetical protein